MLKFEIKKLIKKKVYIVTAIFAILISLYVNYFSNNTTDIDKIYPSYEGYTTGIIFNSIVNEQAYKLENKSEFYLEYFDMIKKYARESYSDVKEFLINKKSKPFNEKYEVGKFIQKLDYDSLQSTKRLVEKYGLVVEESDKKNFEYGIIESEYYYDNNILFTKHNEEILSTNYARRIIYNSQVIFGLPIIAFLIITFYGVILEEKEKGTINLLHNQPISNRKIIFFKFISMMTVVFVYTFIFFLSFLIICLIQGINVLEFRDVFRIYDHSETIKFIKSYKLLPLILVSFFVLMSLIFTIIIFINAISKNKESSLAKLIIMFGMGYTLTENISILQSKLNPFYAIDYVRSIKGTAREITKLDGASYFDNVNQEGLFYIIFFVVISIILFELSIYIFTNKNIYSRTAELNSIKEYGIFGFEIRKIIKNSSFTIYMLGAIIFIFSLHFFKINEVRDKLNFEIGDNGKLEIYQKDVKLNEDKIKKSHSTNENDIASQELELAKQKLDWQERIVDGYKNNDSEKFYKAQLEKHLYTIKTTAVGYGVYKYTELVPFNNFETKMLDEVSIKNNIKPIVRYDFNYSDYEEFENPIIEKNVKSRSMYLTNSSIYTNYRMLKYQDLDILFLVLVLFMVLGGYIYDKENGNQLNLIYTQPISKFKYHLTKIFTQSLVIIGVYGVISIFIFILGILTEGIGELNQPVIEYLKLFNYPQNAVEKEAIETFTTMPIYMYLIKTFIVIAVQGIFAASMATSISIFTKSKTVIIGAVLSICGLGIVLTNFVNVNLVKLLSPFSYMYANNVADNSFVPIYRIEGGTYINSILVLLVWSLVISIIGGIISNKKDQI